VDTDSFVLVFQEADWLYGGASCFILPLCSK
jgi:hypothetical protein